MQQPLLPFPPGCRLGLLKRRFKRFLVEFELDGRLCLAHSNNSGSMLGLTRPGAPVLVSPAASPDRKLPWTLELVGLPEKATRPPERTGNGPSLNAATRNLSPDATDGPPPLWVGVNTLAPNRLLKAAFFAKALPWARGYSEFRPETRRGQSRLDALCTGPGLPPLWVECKNVTLCEDGAAAFPDAVTERGQKHLREMTDIVRSGERAAFFYCVQRADAACFGPADYVDPAYAELFFQALAAGVEAHPHLATISLAGIGLGAELPLAPVRG